MESILSLFIFHDTYVVAFLVFGITAVIVLLLLSNQSSPSSVIKSEVGGGDNIEGALRRVLNEKSWVTTTAAEGGADSVAKLTELEDEVLQKDRKIAELNKQITQGGGGVTGDNDELLKKIAELEERLTEYEIIEDDIADLSLYKTENDKLAAELDKLKAQLEGAAAPEPEPAGAVSMAPEPEPDETSGEASVQVKESQPVEDKNLEQAIEAMSEDLVAEFEKIVDSQEGLPKIKAETDEEGGVQKQEVESGKVVMAKEVETATGSLKKELEVHPKLRNISPDSKEEAEVFISELKSLKKGS